MKRTILTAALLTAIAGGGVALAQTPSPADHAAHHPAQTGATAPKTQATPAPASPGGGMGGGMMGGGNGMMGNGMMGEGGMGMKGGGMCPMMGGGGMMGMGGVGMMGGPKTKVDVKKTDKGVTITLTAPDAAGAARLQKMAEAMRLMHEAMAPQ
jgi:hypothetical protein